MAPGFAIWKGETATRMTDSENHSAAVMSPFCDGSIQSKESYRNELVCDGELASPALIHAERGSGEKEKRAARRRGGLS